MVDEQRVRIRGRKRGEPSILHNSSISKTIIDLDNPAFFQNPQSHKTYRPSQLARLRLDRPFLPISGRTNWTSLAKPLDPARSFLVLEEMALTIQASRIRCTSKSCMRRHDPLRQPFGKRGT